MATAGSGKRQHKVEIKSMSSGLEFLGVGIDSATQQLCDLGQVTYSLCASRFSSVKWKTVLCHVSMSW